MADLQATFLQDTEHGGESDQPVAIARKLVDFVRQAQSAIHIAIYDFRLSDQLGNDLIAALSEQADKGIDVKIAYDHTKPNSRSGAAFARLGGDMAPKGTHTFLARRFASSKVQIKSILTIPDSLANQPVETEPIAGSHLMHNKYIIRDPNTDAATVLTGSTNFTDDAWTYQENNIIELPSPNLCSFFENDFQELWTSGNVRSTGVNDSGSVELGGATINVAFAPGEGATIDADVAAVISAARRRIKIASMVLSSHRVLGALADAITSKQVQELSGIYDGTQMDHILGMWRNDGNPAADTFEFVAAKLSSKRSERYRPDGKHNFMHDKILVCDDFVVTGSFNLSTNATHNAENSLIIHDPSLAQQYADYIDRLITAYPTSETITSRLRHRIPSGPPRRRSADSDAARLDNHKRRSVWFQMRATWPVREARAERLARARERGRALPPAANPERWESVGPSNIGGRMTSITCHPQIPDRIWAGAAGGGVWRSDDAGRSWVSLWHDQPILNVGSLAIDTRQLEVIYCGTGEANLSADSYPGVGLYRTADSGQTWNLLAGSDTRSIPRRIGVIAIDPFDSQHLLIGGIGFEPAQGDLGGLYSSPDGGNSWRRLDFVSPNNYWCHAIVFHPAQPGIIWATVTEQGSRSGVWKSIDGGLSWNQLTTGLPDSARIGRMSLAISPSNPDVLYSFAADQDSGRADQLLGVFRSRDGGATWTDVASAELRNERQISYGNTIVVHPTNPDQVLCGGVDLYLTTNGGSSWSHVTQWNAQRGAANYAHADHHCLLMPAAAPGRVYDMNDGGMDVSEDGGTSWVNRSSGLAATMFYDIDVAQSDARVYGGGAQDNGTVITSDARSDDFFEILGGDGGWIVIDPNDANHLYASSQYMNIWRWRAGEAPADVSPPIDDQERGSVWMVYITLDPSNSQRVFIGSKRIWLTEDDGASWQPISDNLDNSTISAIEVAPADPSRIYVGTENGGIFCSRNRGSTWSPNVASAALPGFIITRVETSPNNADVVFAVVGGFGHSHVFCSQNGGTTWQDIDNGKLPDVPHHAAVIPPWSPNSLYVANDTGVFLSSDMGQTWSNFTFNLPNAMVIDLVHQNSERTLIAATYGRSIYRIKL